MRVLAGGRLEEPVGLPNFSVVVAAVRCSLASTTKNEFISSNPSILGPPLFLARHDLVIGGTNLGLHQLSPRSLARAQIDA
jgi:hypothetical protein